MATLYDGNGTAYEIDDDLIDPPEQQQDRGPQSNSDFAALRKQTQATKAAEKVANDAKREAAFLRAGIDPDAKEGIASYFVKG
jgi:geranylgeranyl pyrophosphate synthase